MFNNTENENQYVYDFMPGELIVVVEHQDELNSDTLLTELYRLLNREISSYIEIERFSTENSVDIENRTFVKVNLFESELDSDDQLQDAISIVIDVINNLYIDMVSSSNEESQERPNPANFQIKAITPNWHIVGNGPSSKIDGGPGGLPSPIAAGDIKELKFPNRPGGAVFLPGLRKQNPTHYTDVVVLDTIPSHDSTVNTDENKHAFHLLNTNINRPILNRLKNHHSLRIYPDPENHTYAEIDTISYPKKMTDHGLFVAGIIHQVAPKISPIHLIEVLNENGVGTIDSLIRGIKKAEAITQSSNNALVVNMSLTLSIPRPKSKPRKMKIFVPYNSELLEMLANELRDSKLIPADEIHQFDLGFIGVHTIREIKNTAIRESHAKIINELEEQFGNFIQKYDEFIARVQNNVYDFRYERIPLHEEMAKSVDSLLKTISSLACNGRKQVYLVAAAGNEAHGENKDARPHALYPAAFPYVTGVAALTKSFSHKIAHTETPVLSVSEQTSSGYADFSNIADFPKKDGIRTLGENLIGPYISDFENTGDNTVGLAKWSGTSFATAIISGVIALISQHGIPDPVGVIRVFRPDRASPTDDFGVMLDE